MTLSPLRHRTRSHGGPRFRSTFSTTPSKTTRPGVAAARAAGDAAERGVRAWLLIDDFYTGGQDEFFLAFAALENVEVRIFNPFCCLRAHGQATRFLASVGDWQRVSHRMHNKLFVADGAMAVIGGRNVAHEFFLRSMGEHFIDFDAFTVGFIVAPAQALFDRYWTADAVHPIHAVTRSALGAEVLRQKFGDWTGPHNTPPPAPLRQPTSSATARLPIADDLDRGRLALIWADAYVFADHPDKPFDGETGGELLETSVTYNVFEAVRKARSMNLDPRSATINTELGAVITSPELARELVRVIDIDRLQNAYRVRRQADGQGLEWVSLDDDREMVLTAPSRVHDPSASLGPLAWLDPLDAIPRSVRIRLPAAPRRRAHAAPPAPGVRAQTPCQAPH